MHILAKLALALIGTISCLPAAEACQITATCTDCVPVVTPGFETNLGTTVSIGGSVIAAWPKCTFSGNACVPIDDESKCVFSRVKSVTFGPFDIGVIHDELLENDNGDDLDTDSTRYPAGPSGSTYAEGGTLRLPCGLTFTETLRVVRIPPLPAISASGTYACEDCVISSVPPGGGSGGGG
jgi:hypothetical protein